MFVSEELSNHFKSNRTIRSEALVVSEWNMNFFENIDRIGNYRFRPLAGIQSLYGSVPSSYDPSDVGNFYTGATDADVIIDGGNESGIDEESSVPIIFLSKKQKHKYLFSLEECFGKFRPRSGINKMIYGINSKYLNFSNPELFARPRYYMPDVNDSFKYWTSYRTEFEPRPSLNLDPIYIRFPIGGNKPRPLDLSLPEFTTASLAEDTKLLASSTLTPREREVVERGVTDLREIIDSGRKPGDRGGNPIRLPGTSPGKIVERGVSNQNQNGIFFIDDAAPFVVYRDAVPANRIVVKMQTNSSPVDLSPFANATSSFSDPFFGESNKTTPVRWKIQYLDGLEWVDAASFSENSLREDGSPIIGYDGYVELYYRDGSWSVLDNEIVNEDSLAREVADPTEYVDESTGRVSYKEFAFLRGLRVVVETMNKLDASFDLIELSPRLALDMTDVVVAYDIQKSASDTGQGGLPIGQLVASTGSVEIFDYKEWFNPNNEKSIISKYLVKNMQIKFFEKILGVEGFDYFVPIKAMYASGFPSNSVSTRTVQIELRDLFFYFESITAPQIFIPNVSLSYAIALLLDSAGFSNYVYKRAPEESDQIIPYFYVSPDQSVAEVLQSLAISTQSAMFFDEYNNFVVMSKGYFLPSGNERPTDLVLLGQDSEEGFSNIIDLAEEQQDVYNDGYVSYSNKYIQRTYGSLKQAYLLDKQKTWVYKPSLLWEVSGTENTKSINEESSVQSGYSLSAIPLNSTLTAKVPSVINGELVDNIMDLGEAIYWLSRYSGYFYANAEIIKYDAAEFVIPGSGTVWISSNREYQDYFSKLKFNGKMYPTGRIRIFAEPKYENAFDEVRMSNGPVLRHGRGQFGTIITQHSAGINAAWTSDDNVNSILMDFSYLFKNNQSFPELSIGIAGNDPATAKLSSRSGVIKNFMNLSYVTGATEQQPVQASALSFKGADQATENSITYVTKRVQDSFRYFGTRLRVVGRIENKTSGSQNPSGSSQLFSGIPLSPDQDVSINGGGGGIGVLVNRQTNNGYYFEISALSEKEVDRYENSNEIYNVFFYKVVAGPEQKAIPILLWSGLADINVDDGTMIGQSRIVSQEDSSVYDLAVEFKDLNGVRRFYLYLNDTQIATVDDTSPLPAYSDMALFVRGSSHCMFENVMALTGNYSENSSGSLGTISEVFANSRLTSDSSIRKYALSGIIQDTFLSGLGPRLNPGFLLYYDEFGTIMREAAYFKARYDKAFPALSAKIFPTYNKVKGYTVSGFRAGAYEAEFLVFNATDSALVLDETTGNYLRIQGITFTQNSNQQLTLDDHLKKLGSLSDPVDYEDDTVFSTLSARERYEEVRISRATYGRNEFSLDAEYIQSDDAARDMMSWLIERTTSSKKAVGVDIFPIPTLQLGDIVRMNHKTPTGIDAVTSEFDRFVVYSIEYSRSEAGPFMKIYLAEV